VCLHTIEENGVTNKAIVLEWVVFKCLIRLQSNEKACCCFVQELS